MTYPVKWFSSAMPGAPTLNGLAGSLISILDACLLSTGGFGSLAPDSVVVAAGIATVTKSAGHTFPAHCVIEVAGATPSDINGEKRVLSITGTTLTFDAPGVSDGAATGTITVKIAPALTWTKAHSGTNKAAYQSAAPGATGFFLRVNDSGDHATDLGRAARVRGYEAMTNVDTGTLPFPTVVQQADPGPRWIKSDTASSAARDWTLIVGESMFYFFPKPMTAIAANPVLIFGDLIPFNSSDATAAVLCYANSTTGGAFNPYYCWYSRAGSGSYGSIVFARSYTGAPGALVPGAGAVPTPPMGLSNIGYGYLAKPCPIDNGYWLFPVLIAESVYLPRGRFPGMFEWLHSSAVYTAPILLTDVQGGSDLMLAGVGLNGYAGTAFDCAYDLIGDYWS